jgi:aminoglycoside phosphotransferase (APT) family kinase protein
VPIADNRGITTIFKASLAFMNDYDHVQSSLQSLNAFIKSILGGAIGDLEIQRQFDSGQSNPTYLMKAGARQLVLRKQPSGHLQPKAHDVAREHDIMLSLFEEGFPVPQPLLLSRASDAIGTQFFLMDYVEGKGLPSITRWRIRWLSSTILIQRSLRLRISARVPISLDVR